MMFLLMFLALFPADICRHVPFTLIVNKLTLINSDGLSTSITILSKHAVKAAQTVRPALSHDVPLASQVSVALETREVLHVPGPTLRLRALVRENDLKQENILACYKRKIVERGEENIS